MRGELRGGFYAYDTAPAERGVPGAGTVHHVAWGSRVEEQDAWRSHVAASGSAQPTPVIDRFYFKSIYFREPNGILFEIATMGPGFAVDEPEDALGEEIALPPNYKHLREQVEALLTPLHNPRDDWSWAALGRGGLLREALGEELLAPLRALAAVVLHLAEERRKLLVALALRILRVLVEPPHVLEAEVRHGDQVVVLVLRPALWCLDG